MRGRNRFTIGAVVVVLAACGGAVAPPIDDGNGDGDVRNDDRGTSTANSSGGGGSRGPDAKSPRPAEAGPGFVRCGASRCAVSGTRYGESGPYCCIEEASGATTSSCKDDDQTACSGHRIACDEAADCRDGNVCCTEPGNAFVTGCRPTCITGAPRFQVCTKDDECENGGPCRRYDCGVGLPPLRFCEKPDGCK